MHTHRPRLALLLIALHGLASCQIIGGIEERELAECASGSSRCANGAREECTEAGAWGAAACPADRALCAGDGDCVACTESDGTIVDETANGDCTVVLCEGGLLVEAVSESDTGPDAPDDCLRPVCDGSTPTFVADNDDHEDDGDACTNDFCDGGTLVVEPSGEVDLPCELASSSGSFLFSCARSFGGEVRCWGANDFGQLGIGVTDTDPHNAPVPVLGLPPAAMLATSGTHACAVLRDATVRCWGKNAYGEVNALNPGPPEPTPVAVSLPQRARSVAAASTNTCALLEDRTVWCWGDNQYGQLGDGTLESRFQGGLVLDPSDPSGILQDVAQIATGYPATCALKTDGIVKCWGSFSVGDGVPWEGNPVLAPVVVYSHGVQVAAGADHFCVRGSSSEVVCWGQNIFGQTGDPTTNGHTLAPRLIPGLSASKITTGFRHSCAVTGSGLVCWGSDSYGELGRDSGCAESPGGPGCYSISPVAVVGVTQPARDVSAMWHHSCAIAHDELRCWGANDLGQLGDGTNVNRGSSTLVLWAGR